MINIYKQPIYAYVITLHNIYYTNIYIGKMWVYTGLNKGINV